MMTDTSRDELIFELLADKYSKAILSLASLKECSASQLCLELGIPLATVYRKLKLLESAELMKHVKTIINLSGNEEKYYRSVIHEITVQVNNGLFSVDLKKEDYSGKIVRLWKRLSHPENEEIG